MTNKSKIEWTDTTWNPIGGCSMVSAGCENCYAMGMAKRLGNIPATRERYAGLVNDRGKWTGEIRLFESELEKPLHWKKPRMVFISMSDLFHPDVPFDYIDKVFAVMALCPQHTLQVLTKRPKRMAKYINTLNRDESIGWQADAISVNNNFVNYERASWLIHGELGVRRILPKPDIVAEHQNTFPLPNVWLGVSIEDQKTADERIPTLLDTPAAVRFVSFEPALSMVYLNRWLSKSTVGGIDWVIVGGESGKNARPMHPDIPRLVRDQCQEAGVPFFFKQWGEWEIASYDNGHFDSDMHTKNAIWVDVDGTTSKLSGNGLSENAYAMVKVGKKKAGRLLDGQTWDEMPEVTNE